MQLNLAPRDNLDDEIDLGPAKAANDNSENPYSHLRGQYSLERANPELFSRLQALNQAAESRMTPDAHFEYYETIVAEQRRLSAFEANLNREILRDPTAIDRARSIPTQLHELEQHKLQARRIIGLRERLGVPTSSFEVHDRIDSKIAERKESLRTEKEKAEVIAFARELEAQRINLQAQNVSSPNELFHVKKAFFKSKAEVTVNLGALSERLIAKFSENRIAQRIVREIRSGKHGGSLENVGPSLEAMANNQPMHLSEAAGRNSLAAAQAGVGRITQRGIDEKKYVVDNIDQGQRSPSLLSRATESVKSGIGKVSASIKNSISSVMEPAPQRPIENVQSSVGGTVQSIKNKVGKWFSGLRGSRS